MEKGINRYLVGICTWLGAVLLLGGCHYDEAQSWRECCRVRIIGDETSSPEGRKTIIKWASVMYFEADGALVKFVGKSWTELQIESALANFLADNPGTSSSDYFASLGMTCEPAITSKDDLTRCAVDLPVGIKCTVVKSVPLLGTPVPKELRKPISAVLHVSVSASASTVLDTSARVVPLPGGRLCHR